MSRYQSRDNAFLQLLADRISRRGLRPLALVALEAGRPLSFLGGQLLWVAEPGLCLFWQRNKIKRLARILENPGTVDTLIRLLKAEQPYE